MDSIEAEQQIMSGRLMMGPGGGKRGRARAKGGRVGGEMEKATHGLSSRTISGNLNFRRAGQGMS